MTVIMQSSHIGLRKTYSISPKKLKKASGICQSYLLNFLKHEIIPAKSFLEKLKLAADITTTF